MKLTPMSEKDAAEAGLWKRGTYDFEIVEAYEKISQKDNPMIELLVKIFDTEGRSRKIKDWLLEGEYTSYKIRHFATTTGQIGPYEKGELKALDCVGKTGRCKLGIKKGNEKYPEPQNQIQDYLPPGAGPLIASIPDAELDDEIPF